MSIKKTWDEIHPIGKTIIVLGSAGLLFFGIRKLIKKPKKIPLPQGGSGLPVVGTTTDGSPVYWNPDNIASKLFNVMDGLFTMSGTKDEVFLQFGQLPSNDMIVSVYNLFNSKYGKGDTLTQWINDEYWTDWAGTGKDLALSRLEQLNLK
jgi:hypothetical protein